MLKAIFIGITTAALALAAAATKCNVTVYQPTVVNGAQLKPGDYKVEVTGDKAIFKQGKKIVEVPVKVQESSDKADSNSLRYVEGNKLEEIRIGGTRTRLLFEGAPAQVPADAR